MVPLPHAHAIHEAALSRVLGGGSSGIERGDGVRERFALDDVNLLRGWGGRDALQLLQLLLLQLARLLRIGYIMCIGGRRVVCSAVHQHIGGGASL